jgi:hypothetical protein
MPLPLRLFFSMVVRAKEFRGSVELTLVDVEGAALGRCDGESWQAQCNAWWVMGDFVKKVQGPERRTPSPLSRNEPKWSWDVRGRRVRANRRREWRSRGHARVLWGKSRIEEILDVVS